MIISSEIVVRLSAQSLDGIFHSVEFALAPGDDYRAIWKLAHSRPDRDPPTLAQCIAAVLASDLAADTTDQLQTRRLESHAHDLWDKCKRFLKLEAQLQEMCQLPRRFQP